MILDDIDPPARVILERYGFDHEVFERLRQRVAVGDLTTETNIVQGSVEPLQDEDRTSLPASGAPGHAEVRSAASRLWRAAWSPRSCSPAGWRPISVVS